MKKIIIICFLLFTAITANAQEAFRKYNEAINKIETETDPKKKSKDKGQALAAYFDSRTAEVGKQTAINETLPYLRQLVDYDYYGAYYFLIRVTYLEDSKMFVQNHLSQDERAVFKIFSDNAVSNYNNRTDYYPSNVPQPGNGLKGAWKNTNNTAIAQTQINNGSIEFKKGYDAFQVKNYIEAMKWYKQSAEKGNADAMAGIGLLYMEGNGVEKSFVTALEWYQKAVQKNSPQKDDYMRTINNLSNGRAELIDGSAFFKAGQFDKAKALFLKGEQKGDLKSSYMLGAIYYEIEKDNSKATVHFQKGADKGDEKANEALQLIAKQTDNAKTVQAQELTIFKGNNGKYGFKDGNDNIIIQPKYDEAKPFSEGLAAVKLSGKWGYIDQNGKEIVPQIYGDVLPFSEGLAAVSIGEKTWDRLYGFIDKSGKLVIPHQYEFVFDSEMIYGWKFVNGKAKVYKDKRFFYIDKIGKEVK